MSALIFISALFTRIKENNPIPIDEIPQIKVLKIIIFLLPKTSAAKQKIKTPNKTPINKKNRSSLRICPLWQTCLKVKKRLLFSFFVTRAILLKYNRVS